METAEYVSVVYPGVRCRVSSSLGKDFGKANMFDGRCDTCWTSKEVNEIISALHNYLDHKQIHDYPDNM
jgi:hypothetical protein